MLRSASKICASGSTSATAALGSIAPETLEDEDGSGLPLSEDAEDEGLNGGDVVTGLEESERGLAMSGAEVLGCAVADSVAMSGGGDPGAGLKRALSKT